MKLAYVDTSSLVAIAFGEPGAGGVVEVLREMDRLLASNLLEAELRSALRREGVESSGEELLAGLQWVFPRRPLTPEIDAALATGYLKGADVWHLACALYLRAAVGELRFVSLDRRQLAAAGKLGLETSDVRLALPRVEEQEVDRSAIRELLRLSPAERLRLAAEEARNLDGFLESGEERREPSIREELDEREREQD